MYALDAANGSVIWQRNVGAPVPLSKLLCGNVDPLGITGTPVVDLPSRSVFFDAMTTPDNGATKKHLIYALNIDTGAANSGWPVDVNATAQSGSTVFTSLTQGERGGSDTGGDQRLHGFDGDTGAIVFSGGGANELMAGTRRFNSGIVARGRIYLANDDKVYAFTVPVAPIILAHPSMQPGDAFQFAFTNTPGMSFTAFGTTDGSASFTNGTRLGRVPEVSAGHFQFTDLSGTNNLKRFYRVSSP